MALFLNFRSSIWPELDLLMVDDGLQGEATGEGDEFIMRPGGLVIEVCCRGVVCMGVQAALFGLELAVVLMEVVLLSCWSSSLATSETSRRMLEISLSRLLKRFVSNSMRRCCCFLLI